MTVKTINFILSTLRGISGADDVAASVLGAGGWSVSEDGSLEAMMHKDLPWEGWMWHPEREEIFSKTDLDRFIRLLKNAK